MHVYWAFEERSTFKWSKSNLQIQGPRMDAIDFELNVLDRVWKFRMHCLKRDSEIRELCLKQGQGFNARAAPPSPSICWIPPPPDPW